MRFSTLNILVTIFFTVLTSATVTITFSFITYVRAEDQNQTTPLGTTTNITNSSNANSNATMVSIVQGAANLADKAYQPNPINIKVGSTITWINHDTTIHTVTEGNPASNVPENGFDSGILGMGEQYQHSFTKAGTVDYHCTLHPTMIGSIIVS